MEKNVFKVINSKKIRRTSEESPRSVYAVQI
jgi:hypothetical protein